MLPYFVRLRAVGFVIISICLGMGRALMLPKADHAARFEPKDMEADSCSKHFDALEQEHGIRHPRDVFQHAWPTYDLTDLEAARCETIVIASDGRLMVQGDCLNLAVFNRLRDLNRLITHLPKSVSFIAGHSTEDTGRCHAHAPAVVHDAAFTRNQTDSELLLPITPYTSGYAVKRAAMLSESEGANYQIFDDLDPVCMWRGGPHGSGLNQSRDYKGRGKCERTDSDRDCVVKLAAGNTIGLNAVFGYTPNLVVDPGVKTPFACILAIDGNSYASLLPDILTQGSLALRIGGYKHDADPAERRQSDYAWYEALLVEGMHYFRTNIDQLESFIPQLFKQPSRHLQSVAKAGALAAQSIFTSRTVECYSVLAALDFARGQQGVIAEALRSQRFKTFDQCEHECAAYRGDECAFPLQRGNECCLTGG